MPERRGGRGKCAACESSLQEQINEELAREVPYRLLQKRYSISINALRNHKLNHLTPALIALTKAKEQAGASKILTEIDAGIEAVKAIYESARRGKNAGQALAAQRTLQGWIELKAKVTGELDERPQVTINLQQTTQWIDARTVVFEGLRDHPELARQIASKLRLLESHQT